MISVILPVYNARVWLPQCIESLLNQTHADLQIVCVDDGSTDGSGDLLDDYRRRDPRVEVYAQPNAGLSASRNTGLERARGEYVMFVDADDWLDAGACALALDASRRLDADIVFWSYAKEYDGGSSPLLFWPEERVFEGDSLAWLRHRLLGPDGAELAHPERLDSYGTAWGKLYRRALFEDPHARYVSTSLIGSAEDVLCNLALFGAARRAAYIPTTLYHYRKTAAGALTKRYKPRLVSQWEELFRRMEEHISRNGNAPEARRALQRRRALSVIFLGLNMLDAPEPPCAQRLAIRRLLERDWCRAALAELPSAPLPLHWKAFFFAAKRRCVPGLYLLLRTIKKILAP